MKRVHVTVDEWKSGETGRSSFTAACHESGCRWSYTNSVKCDVMDHARYHRDKHRKEASA